MSAIRKTTLFLTYWYASLLYMLVFPSYIILDCLANNLNDLRIIIVALEIERGVTKDRVAKTRGVDPEDIEEDLNQARQMNKRSIEMAYLTAVSIILGILAVMVTCYSLMYI